MTYDSTQGDFRFSVSPVLRFSVFPFLRFSVPPLPPFPGLIPLVLGFISTRVQ